ncbi:MAG: hypothetical protein BGN88_06420 [Clostridiales bacterium 43-6]|nr:MAG: hypothetical protein BGN88_06420 [Clostridiales bacterium 43-6]
MDFLNYIKLFFQLFGIPSIISAVVLYKLNQSTKRSNKNHELNRKENIIIMKNIQAIGRLSKANAIAIRDGKINGELTSAVECYEKATCEMDNFLLEQNADR